eukprot:m.225475 g.225475  ORF g.225475 m.225475 type:complete len:234 (+) comp33461_c1_seq2:301-1002(+)
MATLNGDYSSNKGIIPKFSQVESPKPEMWGRSVPRRESALFAQIHAAARPDVMISVAQRDVAVGHNIEAALEKYGYSCYVSNGTLDDRWYAAVSRCYLPVLTEGWVATKTVELQLMLAARLLSTDPAMIVPVKPNDIQSSAPQEVQSVLHEAMHWTSESADPNDVAEALGKAAVRPDSDQHGLTTSTNITIHCARRSDGFGLTFARGCVVSALHSTSVSAGDRVIDIKAQTSP